MKFFKNNLLSILFMALCFSGLSYANTIVRPYGPPDYAGGSKAVGAYVNAEFANIVDWLNGGNISSGNIAAFGVVDTNINTGAVTTAKIADSGVTTLKILDRAVTTAKIASGAVGGPQKASLGQQVSSTSGNFSTSSTTPTSVTNLTVTVTTTGRPMQVGITSTSGFYTLGEEPHFGIAANTLDEITGAISLYRDGQAITTFQFGANSKYPPVGSNYYKIPPTFTFIDVNATPGSHTYTVRAYRLLGSGAAVFVVNAILYAYEL